MRELSLHILDIVQNSLSAGAGLIHIIVEEDTVRDIFYITIEDNGRGMDAEQAKKALDPFYTTRKTRRVGLGLSLLQANAQACEGDLSLDSIPGKGTTVKVLFRHSHLDRAPLGDMPSTMATLISGAPHVEYIYIHRINDKSIYFTTAEMRSALGDVPLSTPEVLEWLHSYLQEEEDELI